MKYFLRFGLLSFCYCFPTHFLAAQTEIYYPHNAYTPAPTDASRLLELAKENLESDWRIVAKTSSSGSEDYNLWLSGKRAEGVLKLLFEAGVQPSKIAIDTRGEADANQTKDEAKDRVVIVQYTALHTEKITEEKKGKDFPADITVWDGLEQKTISGTYTIGSQTLPFQEKIHLDGKYVQSPIKITSTGYRDTIITITEPGDYRIELLPEKVLEKLVFGNIYFFPNSPEILPESFRALEDLYNKLKNRPEILIEIRGHVNWPVYLGSSTLLDKQHQQLSEQRALAVKEWLIKKGIPAEILTHKGFGASRMLYPEAQNEGQMAFNRRVEVILLKR